MDQLAAKLIACRDCLLRFGVQFWPGMMTTLADSSQSSYERAMTVKSWCGGMGSLTDLFIHPMNGHRVTPDEVDRANAEFMHLLDDLLVVANAIITSHKRKPD